MNICIFTGRLTKSPELDAINGTAKTRINLALRRNFKNKSGEYDSDFINVNAWGQQAEYIVKYLKKGDVIEVQAFFRSSSREKNGKKEYYEAFECENIRLISHPKEKGETPCYEDDIPFEMEDE